MIDDPAAPLRRIVIVLVIASLVTPAGMGTALAATDDSAATPETNGESAPLLAANDESAVPYVRSVDEIRGHLLLSVDELAAGDREAAVHHAAEPIEEQWPVVGQALRETNATLERELEAALQRASARAENASADEYESVVRSDVLPLLERAETARVADERLTNATFNAKVVAALLERGTAEYQEGVSEDGGVTEAADYRAGRAFVRMADDRYADEIKPALSGHAAEELDELFERLGTAMADEVGPEKVSRLAGSITHELAEYTGIEAESTAEGVEAIERIEADLHEAVEAYEAGNPEKAKSIVKGTYLSNFEGIEGALIEADPDLVETLEGDFNEELPGLIEDDAPVSEVREKVESMEGKLEKAEEILAADTDTEITITKGNETTTTGESGTDGTTESTGTTTPGFGVLAALLALVLGTATWYRRTY